MESQQKDTGLGALVTGTFFGLLIGAVIGVWKSPGSGAENRQKLLRQGTDAYSSAERAVVGERPADALAEGKAIALQRQQELDQL